MSNFKIKLSLTSVSVSKLLSALKLFAWLGLLICTGMANAKAQSAATTNFITSHSCLDEVQRNFTKLRERQIEWYSARSQFLPSENRRSTLDIGSPERLALLVHGFNSSPLEMRELRERLVRSGFTVLNWLVTGFAARADVANMVRIEDWQIGIDEAIATFEPCGKKIMIIGHSLGGAIASDAVIRSREKGLDQVANLVLLAPYFRTYYPGLNLINDAAKKHTLVADWGLVALIMKVDPRLYLPGPTPGSADDSSVIPLQAVETTLDLQKRFLLRRGSNLGDSPRVLSVVSWNDFVVDNSFAFDFLSERFSSIEKIEYVRDENIPHCLQISKWNPRFEELIARILTLH
jgi:pimeloyl-ACP methyl ester carboxylesterase